MNRAIKFSFLLAFLNFFVMESEAQDERDFRIGIKVMPGVDWTRARTSDVMKNGTGIGFSFGAMADFRLNDNYFLSPEVMITTMSNNIKVKDDQYLAANQGHYSDVEYSYKLKYVEIPLLFKYRNEVKGDLSFWWVGGLAPGFLIENQVSTSAKPINSDPDFPENDQYIPNSNDNNKLDFDNHKDNVVPARLALLLGAGIEYRLGGNVNFYTGLRFNNGFTDMLNDGKSKMINNVMGLELGFFF